MIKLLLKMPLVYAFAFGFLTTTTPGVVPAQTLTPNAPAEITLPSDEQKALKNAADGIFELAIKASGSPDENFTIRMFTIKPEREIVIPYFSNFGGIALICAWLRTRDPKYLALAKSYAAWYEQHRNPDGTIDNLELRDGKWVRTNRINNTYTDSTDATGGTHAEFLMWLYIGIEAEKSGSGLEFLRSHLQAARQDLAAIKLTLQPNGLTLARPDYRVMYAMDNTESLRGSRSIQMIAKLCGDTELEQQAKTVGDNMRKAIDTQLWDATLGVNKWHLGAELGETDVANGSWYPHVMANAMTVAWLPSSERTFPVYAKVKSRLDTMLQEKLVPSERWDREVWLGMAAQGAGDSVTSQRVRKDLANFPPRMVHWFRLPLNAHVCRIIAGDSFTTLLNNQH